MNLIDRLIPLLIFAAAMLPTVLVVVAAVLSLAQLDPALVLPVPVQQAVTCEPCGVQAPEQ